LRRTSLLLSPVLWRAWVGLKNERRCVMCFDLHLHFEMRMLLVVEVMVTVCYVWLLFSFQKIFQKSVNKCE
jgi:hypothetical protein